MLEYGCVVWTGALQRCCAVSELAKIQCMALSAFPGTATMVMETLLSLPPLPSVIKGKAVATMHRLKVWNRCRDFEHNE